MTPFWQTIIDKHYPANRKVRGILLSHSAAVARLAIEIAGRKNLDIPKADIEAAAMLHDIGIIATDAPGIDATAHYPTLPMELPEPTCCGPTARPRHMLS